jgi:hypothetical protein
MKRKQLPALGGAAQHPVPRICGARADPGCRHAAGAGAMRCCLAGRAQHQPEKISALAAAFHRTAPSLQRDTARWPPMRSAKSLPPEQARLPWDAPGLVAGRGRGRPWPAGRARWWRLRSSWTTSNPIAGLADSKVLTAARREPCTTRSAPRRCAAALPKPASRRSTAQHPAGHAAGHAPRRAGPAPEAEAMVLVDGNRLPTLDSPGRGHRQGRCAGAGHLGRLHPGQGAPRPPGACRS